MMPEKRAYSYLAEVLPTRNDIHAGDFRMMGDPGSKVVREHVTYASMLRASSSHGLLDSPEQTKSII